MSDAVRAAITGTGSFLPENVLTNSDLEQIVDTSDEWIVKRTGIRERRIIGKDESTATIATRAGRRACRDAGIDPAELDLIICATITPETPCPATACYIQRDLGASKAVPFDLSAACSGFVYGLAVAGSFIETGRSKKALVIGAETLSTVTDYQDRSSCILFGDGAGAAVLQPTSQQDTGLRYSVLCADGEGWDYIWIPGGGSRMPSSIESVTGRQHFLKMRGRDVYKFAVEKMQWLLSDCMKACDLKPSDVDMIIPHQVNSRIIMSAAEKAKLSMKKVYMNIERVGNTSAASIPIALDEAVNRKLIGPGSTVVLIAFGAGLTWAGAVVTL